MSRTRRRGESVFAVLIVVVITLVGGSVLYFVLTMAVHSDPAAVPSTPGVHAEQYSGAIEEYRRLAHTLLLEENLPGLSVAVARHGEIVWTQGFGWADVEGRMPVTPRTQFRLGSVSKTLTAAAVALLHERGRIDLDAPVQTYVPRVSTKAVDGDHAPVDGRHRRRPPHPR